MSGEDKYSWVTISAKVTVPRESLAELVIRVIEQEEQRLRDLLCMTLADYRKKYPSSGDPELRDMLFKEVFASPPRLRTLTRGGVL